MTINLFSDKFSDFSVIYSPINSPIFLFSKMPIRQNFLILTSLDNSEPPTYQEVINAMHLQGGRFRICCSKHIDYLLNCGEIRSKVNFRFTESPEGIEVKVFYSGF